MPKIRASELIGRRVLDRQGDTVGKVQDVVVRYAADGRYEVLGVITGRSAVAGRLGYGGSLEPPTPLHRILRWLRRHERYLKWEHIDRIGENDIRVVVDSEGLSREWRNTEDG